MPTTAQINANRQNAQASTGPRTEAGKATCANNATRLGLFTARPLIHPDEAAEFDHLRDTLASELQPATVLEHAHSTEILHALWRLRRCTLLEAGPATDPETHQSIERARAHANNTLRRASAELRRLQTERHLQTDLGPVPGLVSHQDLAKTRTLHARHQLVQRKLDGLADFEALLERAQNTTPEITKQTQPIPQPRNSPCPCGSGQKHKRCCGRNAPPVLSHLQPRAKSPLAPCSTPKNTVSSAA
jgi:uncharacterized protein YchJ